MKIIAAAEHQIPANGSQASEPRANAPRAIELPNDADPLAIDLAGVERIDLHFPKFTDGRAYSQARLLRQRKGFKGEIRATGDVLIDQLVQMARCGFDVAVLSEGVDMSDAERQFARFEGFYQGDVSQPLPRFRRAVS